MVRKEIREIQAQREFQPPNCLIGALGKRNRGCVSWGWVILRISSMRHTIGSPIKRYLSREKTHARPENWGCSLGFVWRASAASTSAIAEVFDWFGRQRLLRQSPIRIRVVSCAVGSDPFRRSADQKIVGTMPCPNGVSQIEWL
jgi:hypothetical protein